MSESLGIFVPSRGRPENIKALCQAFEATDVDCENLIVVIDRDDETWPRYAEVTTFFGADLEIHTSTKRGMAEPLNWSSNRHQDSFDVFMFMGDDHRPRSKGWDRDLVNAVLTTDGGIAYGNDLHAGASLPTACAVHQKIVQALHGMVPDTFTHLYIDDFWLRLGNDLGKVTYLPDTIIEHCHPFFGKADMDDLYQEINDPKMYSADKAAFDSYIQSPDYQRLLEVYA